MLLRAALSVLVLAGLAAQPAAATERLLKLRQYTFNCGTGPGQECVGWRHSFAYLDPAAKTLDLPRDTYVDVYTTREVEELIDLRQAELKTEMSQVIDEAMAKRAEERGLSLSEADRQRLRDDIAADVVTQLGRLMAEQEAQTRAWLQNLIREELKAAGVAR
jgi:hypothetical protein